MLCKPVNNFANNLTTIAYSMHKTKKSRLKAANAVEARNARTPKERRSVGLVLVPIIARLPPKCASTRASHFLLPLTCWLSNRSYRLSILLTFFSIENSCLAVSAAFSLVVLRKLSSVTARFNMVTN